MGLVELPLYMPKQTEQFSNNQRVRPDLQAKARRGEAAYGLLDTAVGGAIGLIGKAIEQRRADSIMKNKLALDDYVHKRQRELENKPLTPESSEVSDLNDEEKLMPNFNRLTRDVEGFSKDLVGSIKDRRVRTAIENYAKEKGIAAGDVMFKWDSKIAQQVSLQTTMDTVGKYIESRNFSGVRSTIEQAMAAGTLTPEQGRKWMTQVEVDFSVESLRDYANNILSTEGPEAAEAFIRDDRNLIYGDPGGPTLPLPDDAKKMVRAQFEQDILARDEQLFTGYVGLYQASYDGKDDARECELALKKLKEEDKFYNPAKEVTITNMFLRRQEELANAQESRTRASDASMAEYEDRLMGVMGKLQWENQTAGAAALLEEAWTLGKVSGKFYQSQLAKLGAEDSVGFRSFKAFVDDKTEKWPEEQKLAVHIDMEAWYRDETINGVEPSREDWLRAYKDATTKNINKVASSWWDIQTQTKEVQEGGAEMSYKQVKDVLTASAANTLTYAKERYLPNDYPVNFSGAYAYPDDANHFKIGRGHAIIDVPDPQGGPKTQYAFVADDRGTVTLRTWVAGDKGGGTWVEVKPSLKSAEAAAAARTGGGSSSIVTEPSQVPKDRVDEWMDKDISGAMAEATKKIDTRELRTIPASKREQIIWLLSRGYLK